MRLMAVCAKGPLEESEVKRGCAGSGDWVCWFSVKSQLELRFWFFCWNVQIVTRSLWSWISGEAWWRPLERQSWWRSCHGWFCWSQRLMVILGLYTVQSSREDPSGVRCGLGEAGFSTPPSFLHTYQRCDLISGWFIRLFKYCSGHLGTVTKYSWMIVLLW